MMDFVRSPCTSGLAGKLCRSGLPQPRLFPAPPAVMVRRPGRRIENMSAAQVEGDFHYDSRKAVLLWSILLVDDTNRSGQLEFSLPGSYPEDAFFPVDVSFSAQHTLADVSIAQARTILRPLISWPSLPCLMVPLPSLHCCFMVQRAPPAHWPWLCPASQQRAARKQVSLQLSCFQVWLELAEALPRGACRAGPRLQAALPLLGWGAHAPCLHLRRTCSTCCIACCGC